ncbi:MAG: Eco57I restriction-modification methylase domain-containing protein [Thermoguttaceae bacterium]|jgi:adenine-specific DNA-methyltransferase
MLDFALELQLRYENSTSIDYRKTQGQVFTPGEIARFMAKLFSKIPAQYQLLDPGAGLGILTAAFCERLAQLPSPRHLTAHLFENDSRLIPLLKTNLDNCKNVLCNAGHSLDYIIHGEDFVLAASSGLDSQHDFNDIMRNIRFDGVIMNPPYFKVRKDSEHAKLMKKIVHGQPNMYTFFMALAAQLLKEGGEIVSITPRSFCNGAYFRSFRRWFFHRVALDHIHIFESRTEAFKHSSVLQENIITKCRRTGHQSSRITITKSLGCDISQNPEPAHVSTDNVFDNFRGDHVVRIPESSDDREIMNMVESFPMRFSEVGLRISTGPVVLFRSTDYLLNNDREKSSVPLLLPHNVRPFETIWPVSKNGKPIAFRLCDDSLRLLLPVMNYVLLKRFSAKEEKRRLTAGCFFKSQYPYHYVGIENHLNYIYHCERELTEDDIFGIAALFNCNLFDRYFRTISGNTQVNATEIRTMYFPDLEIIGKIGKEVKYNISEMETIVYNHLSINTSLRECLAGN